MLLSKIFFFFCVFSFLQSAKQSFPQTWGHCIVVDYLNFLQKRSLMGKKIFIKWIFIDHWILNIIMEEITYFWKWSSRMYVEMQFSKTEWYLPRLSMTKLQGMQNCTTTKLLRHFLGKVTIMHFCQTWKSQQISKNCFHPNDVISTRIGGNELIVKAVFVFENEKLFVIRFDFLPITFFLLLQPSW